jgi:hypothetical protein
MRKAKREKINRLMKKENFTFEKEFYYLKYIVMMNNKFRKVIEKYINLLIFGISHLNSCRNEINFGFLN